LPELLFHLPLEDKFTVVRYLHVLLRPVICAIKRTSAFQVL
jgi:hypothetical protein